MIGLGFAPLAAGTDPPSPAFRSVLDEVRALWEAKLVATGVVGEPSNEGQQ